MIYLLADAGTLRPGRRFVYVWTKGLAADSRMCGSALIDAIEG